MLFQTVRHTITGDSVEIPDHSPLTVPLDSIPSGVSANRVYGFGKVILQSLRMDAKRESWSSPDASLWHHFNAGYSPDSIAERVL